MARIARLVAPGFPHHVTQRGNYRQPVFETGSDRARYLDLLREAATLWGVAIWAYCLMTNHVHLVLVPAEVTSIARMLDSLHGRWAQAIHARKGRTGHLWQGRYYSSILDDAHLQAAVRYVEMNPVRARLVAAAWEYPWSSAAARVEGRLSRYLDAGCPLEQEVPDWKAFLSGPGDGPLDDTIRLATTGGRPAGSQGFVEDLERMLDRQIVRRPRGRPCKSASILDIG